MAQQKIQFSLDDGATWFTPAQPHKLGRNFETTYTEDSGNDQTGTNHVTTMFTKEAYSLGYEFLSLADASAIDRMIAKGEPVLVHYLSVYYGGWRNDYFYVGKGSVGNICITEGQEGIEDYNFNIVGVNKL